MDEFKIIFGFMALMAVIILIGIICDIMLEVKYPECNQDSIDILKPIDCDLITDCFENNKYSDLNNEKARELFEPACTTIKGVKK